MNNPQSSAPAVKVVILTNHINTFYLTIDTWTTVGIKKRVHVMNIELKKAHGAHISPGLLGSFGNAHVTRKMLDFSQFVSVLHTTYLH